MIWQRRVRRLNSLATRDFLGLVAVKTFVVVELSYGEA